MGLAAGVVVTVVVVIDLVGAEGGGAETKCESGSEAQPARMRPRALQTARTDASFLSAVGEAEYFGEAGILFFIC